jgi:hypothetical protein
MRRIVAASAAERPLVSFGQSKNNLLQPYIAMHYIIHSHPLSRVQQYGQIIIYWEVMPDLKWSPAEKILARKAFDRALQLELKEAMADVKNMAAKIEDPSALWDMEHWLTQRRLAINRKYDYRYSMLPFVFGTLLKEGRLSENDLRGLAQEKLELIRRLADRDPAKM